MEFYHNRPLGEENEPEKTGESDTSKKKKKSRRRVPLPVETEQTKAEQQSEEKQPKKDKTETPKEEISDPKTKPEEQDAKPEQTDAETSEPLELPEVDDSTETDEETPFLGELVIDHSEEVDEEPIELPEAQPIEEEAAPALDLAPSDELLRANDEPEVEPTPEPTPSAPEAAEPDVRQSVLPPAPERSYMTPDVRAMFDPNAWHASDFEPEPMVAASEAHKRALRAEKRGLSRGVVSGGVVGWWLGRRSGRKQAEAHEQILVTHEATIKRLESQQYSQAAIAEKRQNAFMRAQQELRSKLDRAWNKQLQPEQSAPLQAVEMPVLNQEVPSQQTPEARPRMTFEAPMQPAPEQAPEQMQEQGAEEQLVAAPEGHRYESSAWHRVEVDEKTGRAVEHPQAEYGQAFKGEQRSERLAREAAQAQTAAQLAMTFAAANDTVIQPAPLEQVQSKPASQWQQALQDTDYIKAQLVQQTTSPVTWAIAFTIVVLLALTNVI